MVCKVCNRLYDPSMDIMEEVELLEALDYFVDIEVICPDCLYDVRDQIEVITHDLA